MTDQILQLEKRNPHKETSKSQSYLQRICDSFYLCKKSPQDLPNKLEPLEREKSQVLDSRTSESTGTSYLSEYLTSFSEAIAKISSQTSTKKFLWNCAEIGTIVLVASSVFNAYTVNAEAIQGNLLYQPHIGKNYSEIVANELIGLFNLSSMNDFIHAYQNASAADKDAPTIPEIAYAIRTEPFINNLLPPLIDAAMKHLQPLMIKETMKLVFPQLTDEAREYLLPLLTDAATKHSSAKHEKRNLDVPGATPEQACAIETVLSVEGLVAGGAELLFLAWVAVNGCKKLIERCQGKSKKKPELTDVIAEIKELKTEMAEMKKLLAHLAIKENVEQRDDSSDIISVPEQTQSPLKSEEANLAEIVEEKQ